MKKWLFFISGAATLFCETISSLEEKPWLHPPFEFEGNLSLEGSLFSDVDGGYNPYGYRSVNLDLKAGLLVPFLPEMDAQVEIELEKTTKNAFGFESAVIALRQQFCNDVLGDIASLTMGMTLRAVPEKRLHDVATPYHNLWNLELSAALGKEWSYQFEWFLRAFLLGAIGQANKGYPWTRFLLSFETKVEEAFRFGLFAEGYFGLGTQRFINVDQFDSYAFITHQSIDVGFRAGYHFPSWGKLFLEYIHRAYARSFPSDYNSFQITYELPFSF